MSERKQRAQEFREAAQSRRPSLAAEFWHFLKHIKKWWLLPILLAFLALAVLVLAGGSGVGAFLYTIF